MYKCDGCSMFFQSKKDLFYHSHMEREKEYYIYLSHIIKSRSKILLKNTNTNLYF